MSDEHDDENESEMSFSFFEAPEGLVKIFEEMHDRHQMSHEAAMHEIQHFIQSLDKDQLVMFRNMTSVFRNAPEAAGIYQGMTTMLLETKFKICSACGRDHDADLQEMTSSPNMVDNPSFHVRPWSEVRDEALAKMTPEERAEHDAEIERLQRDMKDDEIQSVEATDETYREQLDKYNLVETGGKTTPFECGNCGMGYISLHDRMIRQPGKAGCDGCIQKEKFG